jgi:hypothetical protein
MRLKGRSTAGSPYYSPLGDYRSVKSSRSSEPRVPFTAHHRSPPLESQET